MGHTCGVVGPRESHVSILLSTFGGEAWLLELIGSIAAQSHDDWSLLVRDDGSTDGTVDLLRAAAHSDERITLIEDDLGNLGPAASFLHLLARVDGGLFAFCDQDDIWLPDKLTRSIAALSANGSPALGAVYTDALMIDADGREQGTDFAARGVPTDLPFNQLLINNAAIGATMVGTAALARRALEVADGRPVLMHDWWVALVAAHHGSLVQLREPTIRWRRHGATVTGATPPTNASRAARRRRYLSWSIDAADWLSTATGGPVPADPAAAKAAAALAAARPRFLTDTPSLSQRLSHIRQLLLAWRSSGVRAWPFRSNAGLIAAVSLQNDEK